MLHTFIHFMMMALIGPFGRGIIPKESYNSAFFLKDEFHIALVRSYPHIDVNHINNETFNPLFNSKRFKEYYLKSLKVGEKEQVLKFLELNY